MDITKSNLKSSRGQRVEIRKGAVFHAENTLNTVGHGQLEAPLEAGRCILVPASKRTTDINNLIYLQEEGPGEMGEVHGVDFRGKNAGARGVHVGEQEVLEAELGDGGRVEGGEMGEGGAEGVQARIEPFSPQP